MISLPSNDKKQNTLPSTALFFIKDFHEMKTDDIVACSTFVALVFLRVLLWLICHPTYLNNCQAPVHFGELPLMACIA